MNAAAEKIQKQIDVLIKERDSLRGEQKLICGFCYHDDHETFEEHRKHSTWCSERAWPCGLKIYVDEWHRDKNGEYTKL